MHLCLDEDTVFARVNLLAVYNASLYFLIVQEKGVTLAHPLVFKQSEDKLNSSIDYLLFVCARFKVFTKFRHLLGRLLVIG